MAAMRRGCAVFLAAALCSVGASAQTRTGTIKGHVRLTGKLPGNPVIRMGMDPKCSRMYRGKRAIQEIVSADEHGNLANVFVRLQGSFPETPVPTQPVIIDQQGCIYGPRVVGMRVGQTLQVKNSDPVAHNVHGVSKGANRFDVTVPAGGVPLSFRPKQEEVMLRVICNLHRWMVTYVGVAANPFFAVTSQGGTFEIDEVPAGTYTIEAWQERYGLVKKTVKVAAGATATVDFTYDSK